LEALLPDEHEVSLESPGAEPLTQSLQLVASRQFLTSPPSSRTGCIEELTASYPDQTGVVRGTILEKGEPGIFTNADRETPSEPQRPSLELALGRALDEIEQQAINDYVRSPFSQLRPDLFHRAAAAVSYLKSLRPSDSSLEAKKLFFEGRALLVEKKPAEALEKLTKANALDPRAAYVHNALGVAYEAVNKEEKALSAFKAAAALAPAWSLPHLHLAIQYQNRGQLDQAEREFKWRQNWIRASLSLA
jgi:tetratricopeptide (TPR) repeat protein